MKFASHIFRVTFSESLFTLDLPKTDLYTRYKSTSPCDIIPWTHEWLPILKKIKYALIFLYLRFKKKKILKSPLTEILEIFSSNCRREIPKHRSTPFNKKRKLFDRQRMSSCENYRSPFLIVFYAWNIIEIPSLSVWKIFRCWSRSRIIHKDNPFYLIAPIIKNT